jgi:hypothetical protein
MIDIGSLETSGQSHGRSAGALGLANVKRIAPSIHPE